MNDDNHHLLAPPHPQFLRVHVYQCLSCTCHQGHTLGKHEVAHRMAIKQAARDKTAELDRLTAELASAKADAEQMRSQWQGAVSRRKVLEGEVGV